MKSLNKYISEWKISNQSSRNIDYMDYNKCFIFNHESIGCIKIFDHDFSELKNYKDNVYINGEHVKINKNGYTSIMYDPGIYRINIKDIDNITNCRFMFWGCNELESVPELNGENIKVTHAMFYNCVNLKEVPLFKINDKDTMTDMFNGCRNLNRKCKLEWGKIYDFELDYKKGL